MGGGDGSQDVGEWGRADGTVRADHHATGGSGFQDGVGCRGDFLLRHCVEFPLAVEAAQDGNGAENGRQGKDAMSFHGMWLNKRQSDSWLQR